MNLSKIEVAALREFAKNSEISRRNLLDNIRFSTGLVGGYEQRTEALDRLVKRELLPTRFLSPELRKGKK